MLLSVIIPNRNDTVMLGITVRSILEQFKAIDGDCEVIVVDNSDHDIWRVIKKSACSPLAFKYIKDGQLKLIRQDFPSMYSARQTGIEKAQGIYVGNCDSHTLHGHNLWGDVLDFMKETENVGFGFSPIGYIDQHECLARSDIRPNKHGSIFGPWGRSYDKPVKISWNFGFRITERDWFLNECGGFGFFSDNKVSWGGGEFYVAMKSWLLGRENWAIPASAIYHIGPFNKHIAKVSGYRYRLYGESGNGRQGIGILGALYALAGNWGKEYARKNTEGLKDQYGIDIDRDWPDAVRIAKQDRKWIEQNQKISFQELIETEPWMEGWGKDRWKLWNPLKK